MSPAHGRITSVTPAPPSPTCSPESARPPGPPPVRLSRTCSRYDRSMAHCLAPVCIASPHVGAYAILCSLHTGFPSNRLRNLDSLRKLRMPLSSACHRPPSPRRTNGPNPVFSPSPCVSRPFNGTRLGEGVWGVRFLDWAMRAHADPRGRSLGLPLRHAVGRGSGGGVVSASWRGVRLF